MNTILPIGRMRRRDFWLSKVVIVILSYGAFLTLLIENQNIAFGLFYTSLALLTYAEIVLMSKRVHDVGYSAWWLSLLMIPFANIFVICMVLFVEGTEGENRFGLDPIKDRKDQSDAETKKANTPEVKVDIMDQIEQLKKEREARN